MIKILVAEDDEDNVDILREFLGDAGYDVVTAANAADAVKLAEDEQPAVSTIVQTSSGLAEISVTASNRISRSGLDGPRRPQLQ